MISPLNHLNELMSRNPHNRLKPAIHVLPSSTNQTAFIILCLCVNGSTVRHTHAHTFRAYFHEIVWLHWYECVKIFGYLKKCQELNSNQGDTTTLSMGTVYDRSISVFFSSNWGKLNGISLSINSHNFPFRSESSATFMEYQIVELSWNSSEIEQSSYCRLGGRREENLIGHNKHV